MTSNKKSVYNIFFGFLGQAITMAVGILLPRLFITSYGSEVNGFLSSLNQVLSYLALLEAGVGAATVQALYGPIGKDSREDICRILSATKKFYNRTGIFYFLGIVVLAVVFPLAVKSEIDPIIQIVIILLVGGSGVISYLFQAKYKLLLTAEGKQYVSTNVTTVAHLAVSLVKVAMIAAGASIVWMQLAQFVLAVVQSAYYSWYIRCHYSWLDLKVEPDFEAISQRNSAFLHEIAQLVFNHTDVLLLTVILQDLKVVSVYTLYNTFVDMISTFISTVNTGFVFRLGQMYNTDRQKHNYAYDCYESYYMTMSFALYSVTYMFLLPFMKLYTAGITDTNYLLPLMPFLFVSYKAVISGRANCGAMISYAGHFKQTQHHAVIEAAINLVTSVIGIFAFEKIMGEGIYGVLLGTLAAVLYRGNIMVVYANRNLLKRKVFCTYKKWIANIALMVCLCAGFRFIQADLSTYFKLIVWAAGCTVVSLILFFAVNSVIDRSACKQICGYAKDILRKRKNT